MEWLPAGAVVLSAIAALLGGFAALRQRRTEEATLVFRAVKDHMDTLTGENRELRERLAASERARADEALDFRERLRSAEVTVGDLRVQVAHCDADKNRLRVELDDLKRRLGLDSG